MAVLREFSR